MPFRRRFISRTISEKQDTKTRVMTNQSKSSISRQVASSYDPCVTYFREGGKDQWTLKQEEAAMRVASADMVHSGAAGQAESGHGTGRGGGGYRGGARPGGAHSRVRPVDDGQQRGRSRASRSLRFVPSLPYSGSIPHDVRRRFRRSPSQAIRRLRPHHSRSEHQGGMKRASTAGRCALGRPQAIGDGTSVRSSMGTTVGART